VNALCAFLVCLTVSVSAYTNADGAGHGITASGARTRPGIVACGPSWPFGTVFLVAGRAMVCMDRGSAITDGHIDVWMAAEDAAWTWGRRTLTVGVLR
jgi:3D (Asp-Asp-Asp) domain-containing protein